MEPTKLIDQIVSAHLKPALQARGFRKQGTTFWRDHGEVIDVVNVQKSRWNDSGSAEFTLNLGLYWKRIHELLNEPLKSTPPKEYQCTVQQRLGFLFPATAAFPQGRDYWWQVSAGSDPASVAGEVVDQLERFGLPWMARLHDLDATLEYIQANRVVRKDDIILGLRQSGLI